MKEETYLRSNSGYIYKKKKKLCGSDEIILNELRNRRWSTSFHPGWVQAGGALTPGAYLRAAGGEEKGKKWGEGDLASSAQTPGGFRSSCQHYLMLRPRSIPSPYPERAVTRWLVAAAAAAASSLQLPFQCVWACWQRMENPVRVNMNKDKNKRKHIAPKQTGRQREEVRTMVGTCIFTDAECINTSRTSIGTLVLLMFLKCCSLMISVFSLAGYRKLPEWTWMIYSTCQADAHN